MSIFRKLWGIKTRPEKAEELDRMSQLLHKRISTRQCDLVRVNYNQEEEFFRVVMPTKDEYHFKDRKACERFLSSHYQAVRNMLDAGCHE